MTLKKRARNLFRYLWVFFFKSEQTFKFNNEHFDYFINRYNGAWGSERTIEIPIIMNEVDKCDGKILEVGNVLQHYFDFEHDIVDKYEEREGVINQDILDFKPSKKYDLIICISTLEHMGFHEEELDKDKTLKAFEKMREFLAPGGKIVITIPIGQNPYLDKFILDEKIKFTEVNYMKRISKDNKWIQTDWKGVKDLRYGSPFNNANAVIVGVIEGEE